MTDLLHLDWGKLLRRSLLIVFLGAFFGLGFWIRGFSGAGHAPEPAASDHSQHGTQAEADTKIWYCSMHPHIRQPQPGKCPICKMDLVPLDSSKGGMREITLSSEVRKLMKIRTAPVERKYVTASVRMVGKVTYDETRLGYITAWVGGRLDRLYVDYTGVSVKKGNHMVYMYSPELYSAQNELIQALKFASERRGTPSRLLGDSVDLVGSAREKLRLLGMTAEQIKLIEQRRKPSDHMTIYSPNDGIVVHKNFNQGDYVKVGDRIYAVADLEQVWVMLDAYESDLQWIRYGQEVTFTTEAYPGEQFTGRISFIDPVLNDKTRTVKVRVNVPNKSGKLKPDMLVSGIVYSNIAAGGRVIDANLVGKWISPMHPEIVKDQPGKCDICKMPLVRAEELGYVAADQQQTTKPLVIPRTAALVTGTRAIVYVEIPGKKEPTYQGREIVLGPRSGEYYIVRSGLVAGELVVSNGNFKLDSALQIQAKPSMMTPEGGGGGSGHNHGDSKSSAKETGMPTMSVPAELHAGLEQLDKSLEGVVGALKAKNLEAIRAAFSQFDQSLQAVGAAKLQGHAKMVWGELAMLLRNDVVEGRDLEDIDSAQRVVALLQDHMRRVREQFGNKHGGHEGHARPLEIPAAFSQQLKPLLEAYFALQKSLAGDDFEQARQGIRQVRAALAAIDSKKLSEPALGIWKKEHAELLQIVEQLEKAKDLKTCRESFAQFSGGMAIVVRSFEAGYAGPVYRLRCSMAFDGRGASWLQQDNSPRNPYYGKAMLSCADQVQQLVAPKTMEEKGAHNHD